MNLYRLKPCPYWNVGIIESWLNDMAKKGYYPYKIGAKWICFKKGIPENRIFKIEIVKEENQLSSIIIDYYKEEGWYLVDSIDEFYFFSTTNEQAIKELHYNDEEYIKPLQIIEIKTRKKVLIDMGLQLFLYIFIYIMITHNFTFFKTIPIILIFLIFMCSVALVYEIYEFFSLGSFIKSLQNGASLNHKAPWKGKHNFAVIFNMPWRVIFVITAIYSILLDSIFYKI